MKSVAAAGCSGSRRLLFASTRTISSPFPASVCVMHPQGKPGKRAHVHTQAEALASSINTSSTRFVLYASGGGLQAATQLLSTAPPLDQSAVLEVLLPQTHGSLADLTGQALDSWCSEKAALALAQAAHRRAAHLSAFGSPILGVSCVAPSQDSAPQGGPTQSFVAVHGQPQQQTVFGLLSYAQSQDSAPQSGPTESFVAVHGQPQGPSVACISLAEGLSVSEADQAVSRVVLQVLSDALHSSPSSQQGQGQQSSPTSLEGQQSSPNLEEQPSLQQGHGEDALPASVTHRRLPAGDPLDALLAGRVRCVEYNADQVVVDAPRRNKLYLPGSFNPLHEGHRRLLQVAKALQNGKEAAFELSLGNPDKGMLPVEEARRRVQQFIDARLPVVVTCAPLFPDKSEMFQDSIFVLGYDTAKRLVMPKYYNDSELNMLLQFARLRHKGCKFLVAGRCDPETKHFLTLKDVAVPLGLTDLFEDIDEEVFRVDVSSTELRARAQRQQ